MVEDDAHVRDYAVALVESIGLDVIVATDGVKALKLLQDGAAPDVLFTDIVMPGGLNGLDLAEAARKLLPDLKVLMTSGYALEALRSRGQIACDLEILQKPYRMSDVAARIRALLR